MTTTNKFVYLIYLAMHNGTKAFTGYAYSNEQEAERHCAYSNKQETEYAREMFDIDRYFFEKVPVYDSWSKR
jgi:hypothetical protein